MAAAVAVTDGCVQTATAASALDQANISFSGRDTCPQAGRDKSPTLFSTPSFKHNKLGDCNACRTHNLECVARDWTFIGSTGQTPDQEIIDEVVAYESWLEDNAVDADIVDFGPQIRRVSGVKRSSVDDLSADCNSGKKHFSGQVSSSLATCSSHALVPRLTPGVIQHKGVAVANSHVISGSLQPTGAVTQSVAFRPIGEIPVAPTGNHQQAAAALSSLIPAAGFGIAANTGHLPATQPLQNYNGANLPVAHAAPAAVVHAAPAAAIHATPAAVAHGGPAAAIHAAPAAVNHGVPAPSAAPIAGPVGIVQSHPNQVATVQNPLTNAYRAQQACMALFPAVVTQLQQLQHEKALWEKVRSENANLRQQVQALNNELQRTQGELDRALRQQAFLRPNGMPRRPQIQLIGHPANHPADGQQRASAAEHSGRIEELDTATSGDHTRAADNALIIADGRAADVDGLHAELKQAHEAVATLHAAGQGKDKRISELERRVAEESDRAYAAENKALIAEQQRIVAEKRATAHAKQACKAEGRLAGETDLLKRQWEKTKEELKQANVINTALRTAGRTSGQAVATAEARITAEQERARAAEERAEKAEKDLASAQERLIVESTRTRAAEESLALAQDREANAETELIEANRRAIRAEEHAKTIEDHARELEERVAEAEAEAIEAERRAICAEAATDAAQKRIRVLLDRLGDAEVDAAEADHRADLTEEAAAAAEQAASAAEELSEIMEKRAVEAEANVANALRRAGVADTVRAHAEERLALAQKDLSKAEAEAAAARNRVKMLEAAMSAWELELGEIEDDPAAVGLLRRQLAVKLAQLAEERKSTKALEAEVARLKARNGEPMRM